MAISRIQLGELDLDAVAASFQSHIILETTDPRTRAQSLIALARSWWLAVADGDVAEQVDDGGE